MKEMERIALLRLLRVERYNVEKILKNCDENTRNYLERRLSKDNDDNVESLDYYINKDGKCSHEYGIKKPKGNIVMCLDCGKLLNPEEIKRVYTLEDDTFHGLCGYLTREDADIESLNIVRYHYLESLLDSSVCDSFTSLVKKYNLK